jgi:hypothetical protein
MHYPPGQNIHAVTVNHNTSRFMELMLRSLEAMHEWAADLSITVYDNASTDDISALLSYTRSRGIAFVQSGFPLETEWNSHGDVLDRIVFEHPEADYYLLLDADVCFFEADTIGTMLRELNTHPDAFGIGVRQSWDGKQEVPPGEDNRRGLYYSRLHPCCALVRNTPVLRKVVSTFGFSCAKLLHAQVDTYLDTAELLTRVMETHGLQHYISSALVFHFFQASYDKQWMKQKIALCDALLTPLRAGEREQFLNHMRNAWSIMLSAESPDQLSP